MAVRARLLEVRSPCTTKAGQLIEVRLYQGTQTTRDSFSCEDNSTFTIEHPSGMAVDVTDLVQAGKIIVQ